MSVTRRQVPSVLSVVVGILLVASPLFVLPHAGQEAYLNHVEVISEDEVPEDATVYDYRSLSPEARVAFERGHTRFGSGYVYGRANKPSEFGYYDVLQYYYIERDGVYYRLETAAEGPDTTLRAVLEGMMVVFGVIVTGMGLLWREPSPRKTLVAFASYGTVLLVGVVVEPSPDPMGEASWITLAAVGILSALFVGAWGWNRSL